MDLYLALQNTYDQIECALFDHTTMLDYQVEHKIYASKKILSLVSTMLENHDYKLDDLSFIAANQGPGPFTTLRVVIASINGISFATHIPLVGVNGLHALVLEYANPDTKYTVGLLNAFNKEVYFGIKQKQNPNIETGYENIHTLLNRLRNRATGALITFIGNGTELYRNEIIAAFGSQAIIPTPLPQTCSIKQVAKMALDEWKQKESTTTKLLPLYLKDQKFKQL